jgi:predicted Zn-dependent protease
MHTGWARSLPALASAVLLIACGAAAAQSAPSNPVEQHTARAEEDLRNHDLAGAEQEYRAILAAQPQNADVWTALGVLLYGSGKQQAAAEALEKALSIRPDAGRAQLFLALSRADQGQCADAQPVLQQQFQAQSAGKLQKITGLALLSCAAGNESPVGAVGTVTRLRQLYPDDPDVLYEAAELYTRLWNQNAGELIAKHPDSWRVHQLAGEVYEAQNNYDQAIREYSLALQQNPAVQQLHFRIGQLYLRKGDPDADDKALPEFEQEKKINPQSATSDLAIADIDLQRHQLDAARPLFEEAARLDPSLVEASIGLAKIELEQNQADAAIARLRAVAAAHPDNAAAHYVLMTAYRKEKKLNQAASELAIFNRLQTQHDASFQNKLNALLGAKSTGGDAARQ